MLDWVIVADSNLNIPLANHLLTQSTFQNLRNSDTPGSLYALRKSARPRSLTLKFAFKGPYRQIREILVVSVTTRGQGQ